jgi:hypothetical protein
VHRTRDNGLPDLDHRQALQIVEPSHAATLPRHGRIGR